MGICSLRTYLSTSGILLSRLFINIMRKFLALIFAVVLVLLFIVTLFKNAIEKHALENPAIVQIADKGKLTVALENNLPGFFTFCQSSYGVQYELLKSYSDYIGVELEVIPYSSAKSVGKQLNMSEVDLALTVSGISSDLGATEIHTLKPDSESNFVVLTSKKIAPFSSMSELRNYVGDNDIVLSKSFTACDNYSLWLDSVSNTALISGEYTEKLLESLSEGEFDVLVCDKFQAQLTQSKYKNITEIYSFKTSVSSSIYASSRNEELMRSFMNWLFEYSATEEYDRMANLYSKDNFIKEINKLGYVKTKNGISPFDNIIKKISDEAGRDWRLVSAIAYSESRFNPDIVSHKGARGLMQIMPKTAQIFNVSLDEIEEPETNVEVALKLLSAIEKALSFNRGTSDLDKICITLAAYNGGVGHVLDARRLAKKFGEDPNKWSSVSKYLTKKSEVEFYSDEVVKSGSFNSRETIGFVATVIKHYNQYCNVIK